MKILVIRIDRIGDLIVSTPVFESIKKSYPDSYIAVMVSPYTKDLLKNNPFVDEIIEYDRNGNHKGLIGIIRLANELKMKRFDVVVTLFSKFSIGLIVYLARIPKRIAPATKISQIFYNYRITQRRSRSIKHEADYNLDLLRTLGIENPIKKVSLWIDEESEHAADVFIKEAELDKAWEEGRIIGIHPGGGGSAKNWGPLRYAQLADELISKHGYSIILTGGKTESKLLETVRGYMRNKIYLYMPENLLHMAAIVKKMNVFVSSSTGPMHIAAALNITTVSLFCPIISCTPVRWGPVGNRQHVLMPRGVPQCGKCIGKKCEYYDCMDLITIESAYTAVADLIGGKHELQ